MGCVLAVCALGRSQDCRKRLLCKVCNLKHPTMLHIYYKEKEADLEQAKMEPEKASGKALISVQSSGLTGAGDRDCTLSVLPVRVKSKTVLMADIEAMFHQVRVPSTDADLLRFLWWPDGIHDQDLVEHRMVVHLFGATSSPSCASFAFRKCAADNEEQFSPMSVDSVLNNFLVDDCLMSIGSEEEAVSLYEELVALCAKGGFKLTKWINNRRTVLAAIPQQKRAMEVKDLNLDNDALPMQRALGVQWDVQ